MPSKKLVLVEDHRTVGADLGLIVHWRGGGGKRVRKNESQCAGQMGIVAGPAAKASSKGGVKGGGFHGVRGVAILL